MKEKPFRRVLIIMGFMLILSGLLIGYHPVSASYETVWSGHTMYMQGNYSLAHLGFSNFSVLLNFTGIGVINAQNGSAVVSTSGLWTGTSNAPPYPNIMAGSYTVSEHSITLTCSWMSGLQPALNRVDLHFDPAIGTYRSALDSVSPNPGVILLSGGGTQGVYGYQMALFTGTGDYTIPITPYPTPTYNGSCWNTNMTNWSDCVLPNGSWNLNLSNNYLPYMPINITWDNLTNRSNITNLFNSSLIDINLVNMYLDMNDAFFNGLRALIASILGTLLYPVTWLAEQMDNFVELLLGYMNNILFYLKPVAWMFQIIILVIPPAFIYIGCVLLCLDFAWWILYGRK